MNKGMYYRCNVCGNLVEKMVDGVGIMMCCNQEMELLVPNTVDAAVEKHVPVVTAEDGVVTVAVGKDAHPMLPEHHIGFITCVTDNAVYRQALQGGDDPQAVFITDAKVIEVYAWCNLHGLWKAAL